MDKQKIFKLLDKMTSETGSYERGIATEIKKELNK